MARRKGWEELSPAYRRRLLRNGIGIEGYESGTPLGQARGHRVEGRTSAIRSLLSDGFDYTYGIDPHEALEGLTPDEASKIASDFRAGFFQKARGRKRLNKRTGKVAKTPSVAQVRARERFLDFLENLGVEMGAEEWRRWRQYYQQRFG